MSVRVQLPPELGVTSPRRFALGGMAELFRGEKHFPQGGSARLVVKHMLPQHLQVAELVSRFRDEARLGLVLRHSNIARVLEYWEISGHHYMVMEEIDGHSISAINYACRDQTTSIPQEVAAFFIQGIASALAYMADACDDKGINLGLVHRDISPSNILVSRDGVVRLIDFGVAKADQRETKTRTGYFVGKFAYMSPEQIRGNDVDVRSDLFALGAVGYELLTGKRPFQGASEYETFNLVLKQEPVPLRETRDNLDPILTAAVERCLAKDPDDRYPHPILLVEDLHRYFHASVERPPPLLATQFLGHLGLVKTSDALEINLDPASTDTARRPDLLTPPPAEEPAEPPVTNISQVTPGEVSSPTFVGPRADEPTTVRRRSSRWLVLLGWLMPLIIVGLLLGGLTVAGVLVSVEPGWFGRPAVVAEEPISDIASEIVVDDEPSEEADPDAAEGEDPAGATGHLENADGPARLVDGAALDAEQAAPTPEPPPVVRPGSLSVKSIPWAEITVDGRSFGRTPVEIPELPPGIYPLSATNPDLGWTQDHSVTIRSGKTTDVRLKPSAE